MWLLPAQRVPGAEKWRVVADPAPHFLFHRYPDGRSRSSLVGPRSRWLDVDHAARSFTVGVRLPPGVLGALVRTPAHELADRAVRLGEVFGWEGRAAAERLEDAASPSEVIESLIAFVRSRVPPGRAPDWRVRGFVSAISSSPRFTVSQAAGRLGVSPRALRDAVREHVGLGPKRTQRVHRLLRGLTSMKRRDASSGAQAAHEAGYVDQAHFVNECRRLLGESPSRFLARGRGAVSCKAGSTPER